MFEMLKRFRNRSIPHAAGEPPALPPPAAPELSQGNLHVPRQRLSRRTLEMHYYAIESLREELEAVDWYRQRADDTEDPELKAILLHNMREEIEHAAMMLEWLRRSDAHFAKELKEYLFQDGPIAAREAEVMGR